MPVRSGTPPYEPKSSPLENRRCGTGGYEIRPYRPASGFRVGAGFMPARDRGPIPAGV